MTEQYCKAKKAMCDPANCNREFCWWRDNVWALKRMSNWAYSTDDNKPKHVVESNTGKVPNDNESEQSSED